MKLRTLLPVLLFLAGCVEVEVHTKMDRRGQGVQTWHFETTALMAGEIQKKIENDPFFRKGKKLLEEFKDGDFIMVLEYPFKKVNELSYKGRDIQWTCSGWFRKKCTYTEVWDKELGDVTGPLARGAGDMIPLTLRVSVEMPGKIVRTNAEETEGSTAKWRFRLGDLAGSKALLVESVHWNWILIAPAGAVLILCAAGLGIAIVRKCALHMPVACPSCGARTSPHATFCASCGARMKPEPPPSPGL
jgi:hypothetical protein